MDDILKPIKTNSLKQEVISHFENLILSGKLQPGDRLPAERDLAKGMEVSRPVIHEGLIELAVKGLITIHPRRGAYINDYQKDGTLGVINSLLDHQNTDDLDPAIITNLLDFRMTVELLAAEKAAVNRREEHLQQFRGILNAETEITGCSAEEIALIDFSFHHLTASASGNLLLPLLMNTLKDIYINILSRFYKVRDPLPKILELHTQLVSSIELREPEQSKTIMEMILTYGASELLRIIGRSDEAEK